MSDGPEWTATPEAVRFAGLQVDLCFRVGINNIISSRATAIRGVAGGLIASRGVVSISDEKIDTSIVEGLWKSV